MSDYKIYCGDAVEMLRRLPDESVHCWITSPPYFGLRDYGVDGQIGLEETPKEYVKKLVRVFREVRRVLRSDGTFWLNIGDSYNSGGGHTREGISSQRKGRANLAAQNRPSKTVDEFKQKDRMGIPHRLVFALQDDGWYWRDEIVWYAPNKMPESATDRCTKAHEFVFLLTKSPRYYFDQHAIREPSTSPIGVIYKTKTYRDKNNHNGGPGSTLGGSQTGFANKRSVWTVPVASNKENHFAAYPPKLILPCILAGTSAKGCCPKCGAPYRRILEKKREATRPGTDSKVHSAKNAHRLATGVHSKKTTLDSITGNRDPERHVTAAKTIGWKPGCDCNAGEPIPCTVGDPFGGTGTTAATALKHNRRAITIELNPEYVGYIKKKIKKAIARKGFGL